MLALKPHFSSAKFELLPYLVRKQFLPKTNLAPQHAQVANHDDGAGSGPPSLVRHYSGSSPFEHAPAPNLELQMSLGGAARRASMNTTDFCCCCYILAHDGPYTVRASSLKSYMHANLDLSRGGCSLYDKATEEWLHAEAPREGNFVLKSFSSDCSRGVGIEVGSRSSIKKSCVGPHVRIGSNVRLTNCVLMDHVVVGDKVTMSNSIVCANADVREGASLKDAQVAREVTIEAGAVVKGEAVTSSRGGGGADSGSGGMPEGTFDTFDGDEG